MINTKVRKFVGETGLFVLGMLLGLASLSSLASSEVRMKFDDEGLVGGVGEYRLLVQQGQDARGSFLHVFISKEHRIRRREGQRQAEGEGNLHFQ